MSFPRKNWWVVCMLCVSTLNGIFVASQTPSRPESNYVLGSAENQTIVLDTGTATTLLKVTCDSKNIAFRVNSELPGTVNFQIGNRNYCGWATSQYIVNGTDNISIATTSATSSYCRTYEPGLFGDPDRYTWQTTIDLRLQINGTTSANYRTTANFSCEWTPRRDAVIHGNVAMQLFDPFNPQKIKTVTVIPKCLDGGAVQLILDSPFSGNASIRIGSGADECQVSSPLNSFWNNQYNIKLPVNFTTPFGSGARCGRQIVNDVYIWNVTVSQRVLNPLRTLERLLEHQFGISCPCTSSSIRKDQYGLITIQRDDPYGNLLALTTIMPVCQTGGSVDLIVRTRIDQGNSSVTVGSTLSNNESCSVIYDSSSTSTILTTTGGPGSPCGRRFVEDAPFSNGRYNWDITIAQSGKNHSEKFRDTFTISCAIRVTVIDSEGVYVEADDLMPKSTPVPTVSSALIPVFSAVVRMPVVFLINKTSVIGRTDKWIFTVSPRDQEDLAGLNFTVGFCNTTAPNNTAGGQPFSFPLISNWRVQESTTTVTTSMSPKKAHSINLSAFHFPGNPTARVGLVCKVNLCQSQCPLTYGSQ